MNQNHLDKTNAKILIVDDRPDNLNLLRKNLESFGYLVVAVPSGVGALEIVERTQPNLIFWTSSCQRWTALKPVAA